MERANRLKGRLMSGVGTLILVGSLAISADALTKTVSAPGFGCTGQACSSTNDPCPAQGANCFCSNGSGGFCSSNGQ
jgi:hypothetical protein